MTQYKLDKVLLPGSVSISQLSNQSFNPNSEFLTEFPAGHHIPLFSAIREQRPTLEYTTTQLASLLGVIGIGGASLGSTVAYLKKAAALGSVARATEEHLSFTIASALAYWSTITLPHNGRGEAQVLHQIAYDGTNEPIVYTGDVALNGNITAAEFFGAGPVALNGTALSGIQEIVINSGISLLISGESSGPWPTVVAVQQAAPTITVRLDHEVNWSTIGLDGTALDGTNGITFYARKYAANGARVANATAQHLKFIGALGQLTPLNTTGQGGELVSDSFQANLVAASDSGAALAITVGSAIT